MPKRTRVILYQVSIECRRHAGHSIMMSGDDFFVDIVAAFLRDNLPFTQVTTDRRVIDRADLEDEMPF